MSFRPVAPGPSFDQSLFGAETTRSMMEDRLFSGDRDEPSGSESNKTRLNLNTVLVVAVSAIIFLTIIAIYELVKGYINNYYAERSLRNPNSNNSEKDIRSTLIANEENLKSIATFALVAIIIAIITISTVIIYIKYN